MSEDAGIEPRTVATTSLAVRRSNHSARSHPHRSQKVELRFSLLFLLDNGRSRIRTGTSDYWIRLREVQKLTDPDPYSKRWLIGSRNTNNLTGDSSVLNPHWFQCGTGSSFLPSCGSGTRERNQCGSMRTTILVRLCHHKKTF